MLFFNLTGSFILYFFSRNKIEYKTLLVIFIAGIGLLYFFGMAGNKRVSFEHGEPYSSATFLDLGRASKNFRESAIPGEFFWPYIYISSPVANLQANILYYETPPATFRRLLEFINNEILFESISKRVNAWVGIEREKEITIKDPFNVSTIYSRSYSYLGWAGMVLMAAFVLVFPLFYYKILGKDNPYRLTGIAILCSVYLFSVYDNTIRLMALGFQLVYPVILPFADRLRKKE